MVPEELITLFNSQYPILFRYPLYRIGIYIVHYGPVTGNLYPKGQS